MNYLFTVALFAISLYVLYSAVTAKGKLFATDNILEEKIPQFVKLLRGIYLGLGVVMLLMAALSGAKQGLYSDANLVGKLTEQFQTDYASNIKANGEIRDTEYNVNDYIRFETAQMLISTLPQPVLASGETFNPNLYFMPSTDADGNNLFMLKTESAPNQNETYAKLRSVFPERLFLHPGMRAGSRPSSLHVGWLQAFIAARGLAPGLHRCPRAGSGPSSLPVGCLWLLRAGLLSGRCAQAALCGASSC